MKKGDMIELQKTYALFADKATEEQKANLKSYDKEKYGAVYALTLRGRDVPSFYVAKWRGDREYHVWFKNGEFWSFYGTTPQEAVNEASEDAWNYM